MSPRAWKLLETLAAAPDGMSDYYKLVESTGLPMGEGSAALLELRGSGYCVVRKRLATITPAGLAALDRRARTRRGAA